MLGHTLALEHSFNLILFNHDLVQTQSQTLGVIIWQMDINKRVHIFLKKTFDRGLELRKKNPATKAVVVFVSLTSMHLLNPSTLTPKQ